jgi:hypothetical protein
VGHSLLLHHNENKAKLQPSETDNGEQTSEEGKRLYHRTAQDQLLDARCFGKRFSLHERFNQKYDSGMVFHFLLFLFYLHCLSFIFLAELGSTTAQMFLGHVCLSFLTFLYLTNANM